MVRRRLLDDLDVLALAGADLDSARRRRLALEAVCADVGQVGRDRLEALLVRARRGDALVEAGVHAARRRASSMPSANRSPRAADAGSQRCAQSRAGTEFGIRETLSPPACLRNYSDT